MPVVGILTSGFLGEISQEGKNYYRETKNKKWNSHTKSLVPILLKAYISALKTVFCIPLQLGIVRILISHLITKIISIYNLNPNSNDEIIALNVVC